MELGCTADGPVRRTATSLLQPVRFRGRDACLKRAIDDEERRGVALMAAWASPDIAPILAQADDTLVMARGSERTAVDLAREGRDDEAVAMLARAARRLWERDPGLALPGLDDWFVSLLSAAPSPHQEIARALLAHPEPAVTLHGDLHHGNLLDFGPEGWKVIDPKGLRGERGYDMAALFLNPDLGDPLLHIARDPARFAVRVRLVAAETGIAPQRTVQWVAAFSELSALWSEEARAAEPAALARSIGDLALGWLAEQR